MTSSPARVLLVGLIAACAHGRGPTEAAPSPPIPQPSPSTVTSNDNARSLGQLLTGRVSGVVVTAAPNGGISVLISGPRSFWLSQEPLFVVDGVPIEAGPNGTLNWLNPQDVASIEVLKYESSTALYGVRGANGVIVIKTKGSHE